MSSDTLADAPHTRRLALGVECIDAARQGELIHPVRMEIEWHQPHRPPAPRHRYDFSQFGVLPLGLMRSAAGRYSLGYVPTLRERVTLRIHDRGRHYVPRRLQVPLRTLTEVLALEAAEDPDYLHGRLRRIAMFPGAGYHPPSHITALRGRVLRDGEPMRWAYVEARLPDGGPRVARARGDDRGEFLLMLPPEAMPASELTSLLDIELSIAGPATVPTPPSAAVADQDPWWDLPVEVVPAFDDADDVSPGESVPAGYVTALSTVRTLRFELGRVLTGREVADFEFVMP
jgi:hypothetical protein